jgi:hypothetical protein
MVTIPVSRWVRTLVPGIDQSLGMAYPMGEPLVVECGKRLATGYAVTDYGEKMMRHQVQFQKADLLIGERVAEDRWSPRVIVEARLGEPNSRDLMGIAGQAEMFRRTNPAVRVGLFVGQFDDPMLPSRLVKHTSSLDFVCAWPGLEPSADQWRRLGELLHLEVEASRNLEGLATKRGPRQTGVVRLIHRALIVH